MSTPLVMLSLRTVPFLIEEIASIYEKEWGWHYREEWDMNSKEEIQEDLITNCLDKTFVLITEDRKEWVGTIALLEQDLRIRSYLTPWLTCLYVRPKYRHQKLGTYLLRYMMLMFPQRMYLWCYEEPLMEWYEKNGWKLRETTIYRNLVAYVMYYEP